MQNLLSNKTTDALSAIQHPLFGQLLQGAPSRHSTDCKLFTQLIFGRDPLMFRPIAAFDLAKNKLFYRDKLWGATVS